MPKPDSGSGGDDGALITGATVAGFTILAGIIGPLQAWLVALASLIGLTIFFWCASRRT